MIAKDILQIHDFNENKTTDLGEMKYFVPPFQD